MLSASGARRLARYTIQAHSMPLLFTIATRRNHSRSVNSYFRFSSAGSKRASMHSRGEAVKSASACWKSASTGCLGFHSAGGGQFVHAFQFADESLGSNPFVIGFLEFEGNSAQLLETRRKVKGGLPNFRRSETGMGIHVESREIV